MAKFLQRLWHRHWDTAAENLAYFLVSASIFGLLIFGVVYITVEVI